MRLRIFDGTTLLLAALVGGLCAPLSLAATPRLGTADLLAQIRCSKSVAETLKQWGVRDGEWSRSLVSRSGERNFFAPTSQLGRWVELGIEENRAPQAALLRETGAVLVSWNPETCAPSLATKAGGAGMFGALERDSFTDAELKAALKRNPNTIVYAWSPYMPLSVLGLETVAVAAKKLGYQLITVVDPEASTALARDAVKTMKTRAPASYRPNHSLELTFRRLANHYPSLQVFKRGRPAGPMIPGYSASSDYVRLIREQIR